MKRSLSVFSLLLVFGCSEQKPGLEGSQTEPQTGQDLRPNILLIVADDLGFSDIGAFGGEISTPNLDRLAKQGTQLTNFHVAPTCSPTRSMLLSGTDNHRAGFGTMFGMATPEQQGRSGYEGHMNFDVVAFPRLLQDAGYHTYMAGKWHINQRPVPKPNDPVWDDPEAYWHKTLPGGRGFENSFTLLQGGGSHFDMTGVQEHSPKSVFFEDGRRLNELPADYYSSKNFTDKLIGNIEQNRTDGKPFFAYAAYSAPHWPLHAPDEYIEKYAGIYQVGYDVIQRQRLTRMKQLGVIPEHWQTNPGSESWPKWDSLTAEQRASETKKMQVYAAMVTAMDFHIGRLINYLRESGELENTVILFMSDNGAEGNNPADLGKNASWIPANFDNSLENMGRPHSYIAYGPGWAQVSATPFRMYKAFTAEGGIISPMIASFPGTIAQQRISNAFTTVLDIAPTLLEMAQVPHPGDHYQGRRIHPLQGDSMVSFLSGAHDRVHPSDYAMGWELFGRRAIIQGDWKIISLNQPWGTGKWELFNLREDPAELSDLSVQQPEKLTQMIALWEAYAQRNGVVEVPPADIRFTNTTSYYQR